MAIDEIEIERSWILRSVPDKSWVHHSIPNEIGYVFSKDGELRIYKKRLPDKLAYGITVKDEGDLSRKEWEDKQFPEWAFEVVWPNTTGARVYKTRHFIPHGPMSKARFIEVDEYSQVLKGLVRMECEFPSEQDAADFVLPPWAHANGAIEVTNDPRFKGKNLAQLSRKEFKELMDDYLSLWN